MKTRLLNLFDKSRESFWFAPATISILSAACAFGILRIDGLIDQADMSSNWFVRDASAARQILTSVAGSVMTLAGVVFSITLVAISIASSQFGSRLLRCFMVDSFADRLIGLLLGTCLVCYIVLNSVYSGNPEAEAFVPQFATAIAALMGLVSVAMLIWFVHDTAQILQAPRLIATVAADLDDAIERLFPEQDPDSESVPACLPEVAEAWRGKQSVQITVDTDGYIEGIDHDALVTIAQKYEGVIAVLRRPGHFVTTLTPIVALHSDALPSDEDLESLRVAVRSSCVVGMKRTPRQDVTCSIIELVEVADRALSPGVNNPFAAMNCIDRLGAALSRVINRPFPPREHFDNDGQLRLLTNPVSFADLLKDSFAQIRQYGSSTVPVAIRMIDAYRMIAEQTTDPKHLNTIRSHAEAVEHQFSKSGAAAIDVRDFNDRLDQLKKLWAGSSSAMP